MVPCRSIAPLLTLVAALIATSAAAQPQPPSAPAARLFRPSKVELIPTKLPPKPGKAPAGSTRMINVTLKAPGAQYTWDTQDKLRKPGVERFTFIGQVQNGKSTKEKKFTFTVGKRSEVGAIRILDRCAQLAMTVRGNSFTLDIGLSDGYVDDDWVHIDLDQNPALWFTCFPF